MLKAICSPLASLVRKSNYLVWYSGEEGVIIVPDLVCYSAKEVVQEIRKLGENQMVQFDGNSIAVCTF